MSNQVYSLAINYNAANQFASNILHYQFDDSGFGSTAAAALALCNAFDAANRTPLKSILPTSTTLLSYKARCLTQPGGFEGFLALAAGQTGTRTGNVAASGVCPLAILYPPGINKQRGKVFLPGITDTDAVDGEYSVSYVTAFDAAKHIFTDPLTLAGGGAPTATPVIYSRATSAALIIAHVMISQLLGTQRRRQRPA
jgi:hypothetical protein